MEHGIMEAGPTNHLKAHQSGNLHILSLVVHLALYFCSLPHTHTHMTSWWSLIPQLLYAVFGPIEGPGESSRTKSDYNVPTHTIRVCPFGLTDTKIGLMRRLK